MAEYLIQGETLTNMADEIRTLSGTTGTMNPNEMTEHVADANVEITSQAAQIARISALLEGKASGGGDGAGATYEACNVRIDTPNIGSRPRVIVYEKQENGEPVTAYVTKYAGTLTNVVCNSTLTWVDLYYSDISASGAEMIFREEQGYAAIFRITAQAGATATIENVDTGAI